MNHKITPPERGAPLALSRRAALLTAAGTLVGAGFNCKATAAEKVYFASYGGSYGDALEQVFFTPFTRETGIEVVQTPPATIAKLRASIAERTVEWDVIDWLLADVQAAATSGFLEPINYSQINTDDLLFPQSRQTYYTSMFIYTSGIGYNAKRYKPGLYPTTWREFWDVKAFPGRRALRARPQDTLELALLAVGVPPNKIYPIDTDLAFKALKDLRPYVQNWTTTPLVDLLQRNEVDFMNALSGRVLSANKAGSSLGYSQKQLMIFFAPVCVPKGAPNPQGAMKLLGFMADAKRQAALVEMVGYLPMKRQALDMLSAQYKEWIPNFDDPNHLVINPEWWALPGRLEELTARFKEFLLS